MDALPASIVEAAQGIATGRLSPVQLVERALQTIQERDPELKAFVTVAADLARQEAAELEKEAAAGTLRGALHGIPVGIKDIMDTAGIETASGSLVRAGRTPHSDATVVTRLKRAGAIVIGKTNTHEFALGPITPPTRNAWDPARIPGGSSGGSGTAVAAGMCMAALGTDTGGSIRIPAGFNGIVGLKPTYGRVPKTGITTLCWSLDHVGPMTRTVGDAAVMLQAIAGHDGADVACAREVVDDYLSDLESGIVGLRLGIPQNYFREIIQNDVLECVDAAVSHFKDLKAKLVEVTISDLDLVLPAEFAILLSEAGAYHQSELRRVADLYGEDVRSYLELGELHLATHYLNAQRARGRVKEAFRRCFTDSKLDALIVPSLPIVAPKIGEETITYPDAGEQPMVTTVVRMVSPFNLSGQPVLSVPCGFIDGRLPVALGIVGRPFAEATVLKVGQAYERSTDWHRKRPSSRQDQELATPPRHLGGKLRGGL